MPCPFRTFGATAHRWHKLRIPLVERGEFQDKENVRLNPELQAADGEKNGFRLLPSRAPILFEASGKCLFLLVGLELRQQERMADADLFAVKRIHDVLRKLGQFQPSGHMRRALTRLRADLLNAVLRLFQVQQSAEPGCFFHRVNVGTLKIFNELGLDHFCVGHILDANGHGVYLGNMRRAIPPRPEDNLEALLCEGANQQRRQYPMHLNGLRQFMQSVVLEAATWVGLGLGEQREWHVAVLSGVDNSGVHDDKLLLSGCTA